MVGGSQASDHEGNGGDDGDDGDDVDDNDVFSCTQGNLS